MPGKTPEKPPEGFNALRTETSKNTQKFRVGEHKFLNNSHVIPQNPKM